MIEVLKQLGILEYLISIVGLFIIVMSSVYIPGRMLEIISNFRIKNIIAIVFSFTSSYVYLDSFKEYKEKEFVYYMMLYFSGVIFLYVLFGMRLFDRVDNYLDKKIAKDKKYKKK
jgi:hypothetical protein